MGRGSALIHFLVFRSVWSIAVELYALLPSRWFASTFLSLQRGDTWGCPDIVWLYVLSLRMRNIGLFGLSQTCTVA